MFDMIMLILTHIWCFALSACLVGGVVIFILAVSWIQVNERKEQTHEQKSSAQESISAYPAAKRRRRRTASCYPCQMP